MEVYKRIDTGNKKGLRITRNPLILLAESEGFEPPEV